MTSKRKKYRITTETHEVFIVRQDGQRKTTREFCPACKAEGEMFDFDSAISFSGISGRELIRRLELGEVHSIETANGHLLICKRSLRFGEE
jgi:hypothetical protein